MVLASRVVRSVSVLAALTGFVLIQFATIYRAHASAQLVDTKSVNNTTLLHFLERTIHKHFPHMEEFLEELNKPAEAYRGLCCTFLYLAQVPNILHSQHPGR